MKCMILAAVMAASLAIHPGGPARQICTTRACPPVPVPMVAGLVASATSDQLVLPRSPVITVRDCVGLTQWAALVAAILLWTRTLGPESCGTTPCAPVPAPMVAGNLV